MKSWCKCSHQRSAHAPGACALCASCDGFKVDYKPHLTAYQAPELDWQEAELLKWANKFVRPYTIGG